MKAHQNKRTLPVKSNLQHRTAVRQPISRQASLLFGQRTLDFRTEEGDWLSWLEHYLDMVGVTGSSPVSPIPAVRRLAKISADPRKTVFSWVCLFRCAPVPPVSHACGWDVETVFNQQIVAFRSAETYVQRSPAHRQAEGVSPPRRPYLLLFTSKVFVPVGSRRTARP